MPAHAVLGMAGPGSSLSRISWYHCQWATLSSAWTTPLKLGESESSKTLRRSAQAAPTHWGAVILNAACAHPRTLCMKLPRGGGSVKTSPWLGCKHPAGGFSCVPGTVGAPAKAYALVNYRLPGPLSWIMHFSVSNVTLNPRTWFVGKVITGPSSSCDSAFHPGSGEQKASTALCGPGMALKSIIFRDVAYTWHLATSFHSFF